MSYIQSVLHITYLRYNATTRYKGQIRNSRFFGNVFLINYTFGITNPDITSSISGPFATINYHGYKEPSLILDIVLPENGFLSQINFGSLVMPVLLCSCEAWTLTADLRRRLDSFATTSLRRILGYSWQDRASNQKVLREAGMSRVTCLIRERQLCFYGHVVRFPMDDPAHRILNAKDPVEWNRRRNPNSSWLAQLGNHMK